MEMYVYNFSEDGKELIIKTPKLYRPWCNYISNKKYGLKFSQTGGGFSLFPLLEGRRITRYGEGDQSGRYVYMRDNESNEVWSLNWQPIKKELEKYECRHGLGYSVIKSKYNGIQHSLRVSALQSDPGEIWTISITNRSGKDRNISFFPFVDWYLGDNSVLWDAPSWYTKSEYLAKENLIVASFFNPVALGEKYSVFMKPFFNIDGYCCSKRTFCGFSGSLQNPKILNNENFKYGHAHGEETIGCFERKLSLKSGESLNFQLIICYQVSDKERDIIISNYATQQKRTEDIKGNTDFWNSIVKKHEILSPDKDLNNWINIWLKYQEYQCFRWAGLGEPNAPLMGYRDVLQHTLAMSLFAPEMAKDRLIEALRHQYSSGRAVRQWSRKGNHDRRDYRDSPVWIIFSLCSYLKETNDFSIIDETVPYLEEDGEDTVLEHAINALNALYNDRGQHGLSRIGEGDWYDPLNKIGIENRGESVWLSMALTAALKEMADLWEHLEKTENANLCRARAQELTNCINKYGWDGEWYLYAYDDSGNKVGSHECEEGKIFANTQIWAIISGVADDERAEKCLFSMDKHLKNIFGYAITHPTYSLKNKEYGNVGILQSHSRAYSHVSSFKMVSDCILGRGKEAYNTFKQIIPTNPVHPPEKTMGDPHIIPNGYSGVNANKNEAAVLHSGSSGAFPWILKAVIEHMFGAMADYGGLRICPCLPSTWKTASIRREYRGAIYNICIKTAKARQKEPIRIIVDGTVLNGNLIEPHNDGKEHSVLCILE